MLNSFFGDVSQVRDTEQCRISVKKEIDKLNNKAAIMVTNVTCILTS